MKTLSKIFFLIIFATIALTGCSGETPNIPFLNSPTPTASNTPTPTNTITPSPTPTYTPTPTITPTPTPIGGGSGKVIFGYTREGFESEFPDLEGESNVFIADLDGGNLTPITNGLRGYNYVEALSPDGSKVLISSFTSWNRKKDARGILYLYDLNDTNAEPVEIVQGFSQQSHNPAAGWINNTEIVYIGTGEKGYGIYRTNTSGAEPVKIDVTIKTPERILAIDEERVYWSSRIQRNYYSRGYGTYFTAWWTNLDGSDQGGLELGGRQIEYIIGDIEFSHDGKQVAWFPSIPKPECDTEKELRELSMAGKYGETCLFLYEAELSKPTEVKQISLLPPQEATEMQKNNYVYSDYSITWDVDDSRIFLLHNEYRSFNDWATDLPPELFYVIPTDKTPKLLYLDHDAFKSNAEVDPPGRGQVRYKYLPLSIVDFSADEKQILVLKLKEKDVLKYVLVDLKTMEITRELFSNLEKSMTIYPRNIHILP